MLTRRELIRSITVTAGAVLAHKGLAAEYQERDGLGLAELIRRKEVTPLELLNEIKARAESVNPKLNAFCQLFFEKAELQIKQGLPDGPFGWCAGSSGRCRRFRRAPGGGTDAPAPRESDIEGSRNLQVATANTRS
jgi:hypothetical protein